MAFYAVKFGKTIDSTAARGLAAARERRWKRGGRRCRRLVSGDNQRAYVGRSRFVLTPLSLSLDQLLFLITAALLCFGLIMVQSADSRVRGVHENWLAQSFNNKNAIHAGIALLVMAALWRLDYRMLLGPPGHRLSIFASPSTWFLALTVALLLAVLATPLGEEFNGARRWLALGPIGFQPSELAKLSLVLFVSAYAGHYADEIRTFGASFIPLLLVVVALGLLVIKPQMLAPIHALAFATGDPTTFMTMKFGVATALLAAAYLIQRRYGMGNWAGDIYPRSASSALAWYWC